MQLGLRLHDTRDLPFDERIAEVASQGFSCGHLALAKVFPKEISTADEALTPGFANYLRKIFAKHDVDCAVLGCYLNLANPNPVTLAKTTHRYMANIRFAAALGAGVVGTETGAPNEGYTYGPECYTEEALQIFIKNLRPVVEYAEKMGVIVAIEPVFKHIVCNPERTRRVLDTIHSPNLQIIFDPVNLLDISNIDRADEVFAEAIDAFGDDVAVMHLKDYRVQDGKLLACGAGLGEMNFDRIMKFLKTKKPYIYATLENTTPGDAVQCREFLEKEYAKA
ncbi:MAG: sugar phosphate isomerase/epimerase [Lachnospiraceae bacterium]|nr:sugar phosphate isomerase/epimerase [Lachnospiraceae bacterium]